MSGRVIFLAIPDCRDRMSMREAAPNAVSSVLWVRPEVVQEKFRPGYDGDALFRGCAENDAISQFLVGQLFVQVVQERIVRCLCLTLRTSGEQHDNHIKFQTPVP